MAFPPYGTSWPSLVSYQASFAGYKFGPSTNLEVRKVEGLDMPPVRTGDAGRPRDHGFFRGLDVMGGREPMFEADLHNLSGTLQEAEEALAEATVPGGSEDTPLFVNLPGWGTLASMCRVRKRQMPRDIQLALGNLGKVSLLFFADDPRLYAQPEQVTVTPPNLTLGLKFPLKFNFSFGGGTVAGSASVTNAGNVETRPLLIVEGPCETPSITNATAPGSPQLAYNLTVAAGAKLVIDTDMHTATYFTSGSTVGSTRAGSLKQGSEWWTLAPGANTIQFLAGNVGEGTLKIQYASAWVI